MINTKTLRDIESDKISLFCSQMAVSMSASSVRLFRLDIGKFLVWFRSADFNRDQYDVADVVNYYADRVLFDHKNEIRNRKLNSIRKFLHWIDEDVQSNKTISIASTTPEHRLESIMYRLSYQHIYVLLFIFFVILGFIGYSIPLVSSYYSSSRNRVLPKFSNFNINIPVVSNKLPQSLNSIQFILTVFSSKITDAPLFSLKCIARSKKVESNLYISINSKPDCKLLAIYSNYFMPIESDFWVDVAVGATKVSTERVHVVAALTTQTQDGQTQGQVSTDFNVSSLTDSVIENAKSNSDSISSDEALLITRPNNTITIPLDISQVFEISHGDAVTLTDKTITKAILNNPIIGVVNDDSLIVSGVAEVNMSKGSSDLAAGDYVSTSLEPGKATRASLGYENIIGISLEAWSKNKDKVKIFVNRKQ